MIIFVALGVRFILELCIIAALAVWSYRGFEAFPVKLAAAVGFPSVVAIVWARYLAPHSSVQLDWNLKLILEAVIFIVATYAVWKVTAPFWAVGFLLVWIADKLTLIALGYR
ncbi:MAG: YrdB family protein [Pseudomonadota bacterium]|nr:YrdB family protein [Pseudomonadota bacterium]